MRGFRGVHMLAMTFLVAMATVEIPKLLLVSAISENKDGSSKGDYKENCWPDRSTCVNSSAKGSGLVLEKCWLRCKCRGYLRGWCSKTEECEMTGNPYKCKCTGPTDSKYWLRLCNGFLGRK